MYHLILIFTRCSLVDYDFTSHDSPLPAGDTFTFLRLRFSCVDLPATFVYVTLRTTTTFTFHVAVPTLDDTVTRFHTFWPTTTRIPRWMRCAGVVVILPSVPQSDISPTAFDGILLLRCSDIPLSSHTTYYIGAHFTLYLNLPHYTHYGNFIAYVCSTPLRSFFHGSLRPTFDSYVGDLPFSTLYSVSLFRSIVVFTCVTYDFVTLRYTPTLTYDLIAFRLPLLLIPTVIPVRIPHRWYLICW